MAQSEALLGFGTLFQTESLDSPNDWVTVGEQVELSPPDESRDALDCAHEAKPGEWVESIPGRWRGGEMELSFNFIPGGVTYAALEAEKDDQDVRNRRIVFPNGAILPFAAFLKGLSSAAPLNGALRATAKFQVSGQVGPLE